MNIDTMDKVTLLKVVLRPIMDQLGVLADNNNVDADDVVDLFAMGIAAIIDNDTSLRTPAQLESAVQDAAALISRRTNEFRTMQDQAGMSWFKVAMMTPRSDEPTVN